MVLQFNTQENVWNYEEADIITVESVELPIYKVDSQDENLAEKIRKEIEERTNCTNIDYVINKPIYECGVVHVVTLFDEKKHKVYVFDEDKKVYVLNNSGKTIRRVVEESWIRRQ